MTKHKSHPIDRADLRRRAEEKVQADMARTPVTLSREEVERLLHELRVHQIELEMQNEELRRAQSELEVSRARYFDLYDLAPVGYFTLSEQGMILEANLTGAGLLGVGRRDLTKQSISHYILPEDQDIYYRHRRRLLETGTPQECELRMLRAEAGPFSGAFGVDRGTGRRTRRFRLPRRGERHQHTQANGGAVGRPESPKRRISGHVEP